MHKYDLVSFIKKNKNNIEVIKYYDAIIGEVTDYDVYDDRIVIVSGKTELHIFKPYTLYQFYDTNIYNLYRDDVVLCQIKLKDNENTLNKKSC